MTKYRYVIEVKDEFGWNDYAKYNNLALAQDEARELVSSFGDYVRLIDTREAMRMPY